MLISTNCNVISTTNLNFLDVISVRNCNGVVDSSNWMLISDSLIPMFGVWSLEIERVTLVDSNLAFFFFVHVTVDWGKYE